MDQIVFQLTTSRRGRQKTRRKCRNEKHFNSLPHAEVDALKFQLVNLIWKFQLTTSRRGRQNGSQGGAYNLDISTHYLTQR